MRYHMLVLAALAILAAACSSDPTAPDARNCIMKGDTLGVISQYDHETKVISACIWLLSDKTVCDDRPIQLDHRAQCTVGKVYQAPG